MRYLVSAPLILFDAWFLGYDGGWLTAILVGAGVLFVLGFVDALRKRS